MGGTINGSKVGTDTIKGTMANLERKKNWVTSGQLQCLAYFFGFKSCIMVVKKANSTFHI